MRTVTEGGYTWEPGAHFMWRNYRLLGGVARRLLPGRPSTVPSLAATVLADRSRHYFSLKNPLAAVRHPAVSRGDAWPLVSAFASLLPRLLRTDVRTPASLARLEDGSSLSEWSSRRLSETATNDLLAAMPRGMFFWPPEQTAWFVPFALAMGASRGWWLPPGGMGAIPETLASRLQVNVGYRVREVKSRPTGGVEVRVDAPQGAVVVTADAAVVAVPGPLAMEMLADPDAVLSPARASYLRSATYVASRPVTVAYDTAPETRSYAVGFAAGTAGHIVGLGWEHLKASGRAANGHGLAAAMPAPEFAEQWWDAPDVEFAAPLVDELDTVYPGSARHVVFTRTHRWTHAMPRWTPNRFTELATALAEAPLGGVNVHFCGDSWGGPSTELAYASGQRAAAEALAGLKVATPAGLAPPRNVSDRPVVSA